VFSTLTLCHLYTLYLPFFNEKWTSFSFLPPTSASKPGSYFRKLAWKQKLVAEENVNEVCWILNPARTTRKNSTHSETERNSVELRVEFCLVVPLALKCERDTPTNKESLLFLFCKIKNKCDSWLVDVSLLQFKLKKPLNPSPSSAILWNSSRIYIIGLEMYSVHLSRHVLFI
jgi:hypothetical protein